MLHRVMLVGMFVFLFARIAVQTDAYAQSAQARLTGVITFHDRGGVSVFELPFDNPRQLIEADNFARNARGEILYTDSSPAPRSDHLTLMGADGLSETDLRNDRYAGRKFLELSDDGQRIAYRDSSISVGTVILTRSGRVDDQLNFRVQPMQWITTFLVALDQENPNQVLVFSEDFARNLTFVVPRGDVASARFSPSLSQLAYEVDDQIWVADVNFEARMVSNPMRLSTGRSNSPSWSPDGQWIIYIGSDRNGCLDCLHVVPAAGGEPFVLVDEFGETVDALRTTHVYWHRS